MKGRQRDINEERKETAGSSADFAFLKSLGLAQGDINIVHMVWGQHKSFGTIAEEYRVPEKVIVEAYTKAIHQIKKNIASGQKQYENLSRVLDEVQRENRELKRQLAALPAATQAQLPGKIDVLKLPISKLELPARAQGTLRRLKVQTLGDLSEYCKKELLMQRNFNVKTLRQLEKILEQYNMTLKD